LSLISKEEILQTLEILRMESDYSSITMERLRKNNNLFSLLGGVFPSGGVAINDQQEIFGGIVINAK